MLREQVLKFCETNYDFIDREKILDSDSGYSKDNWKQICRPWMVGSSVQRR